MIYEINFSKPVDKTPSSYIFLIDDSGSMESNDPTNLRNSAIFTVVQQCDGNFPICIYKFASGCERIQDIQRAASAPLRDYGFCSEGGTDIVGAISRVLTDIQKGSISAGQSPIILLFSDGESSSLGMKPTLREAKKYNVAISTIGLDNASERYLKNISSRTGGVYISINDISQLGEALNDAGQRNSQYERNLLNFRIFANPDYIYAIIRFVFLLVLCLGGTLLKAMYFCATDMKNKAVFSSIVFSVIGAALIEFGMNSLCYNENTMRLLFCICYMALIGTREIVQYIRTEVDEGLLPDVKKDVESDDEVDGYNSLGNKKHGRKASNSLLGNSKPELLIGRTSPVPQVFFRTHLLRIQTPCRESAINRRIMDANSILTLRRLCMSIHATLHDPVNGW